jgi:RNA ligase
MIDSVDDIIHLCKRGFTDWKQYGRVSVKESGDLLIFSYTQQAVYAAEWNFFERVSRGLIINRETGEIVARPFDKFYNWGEGGRTADASIVNVTEKVDGSLGILYRQDGGYKLATRGSFDSDQAKRGTAILNEQYDLTGLPNCYTLLFEIIYPENRIVVDYGGFEALYLLAIRNRFSGEYLSREAFMQVARQYHFLVPFTLLNWSVAEIIEYCKRLDANHEGWVAEFADGQRFKFKGAAYLELHKLISGLTFSRVLDAVAAGNVDEMMAMIPEEYRAMVDGWIEIINTRVECVTATVEALFNDAPKDSRKDFAMFAGLYPQYAKYLFLRLDSKDYKQAIYKAEKFDVKDNTLV